MKKWKVVSALFIVVALGIGLTACGNQHDSSKSTASSSTSSQPSYQLASSSAKLDPANLTPKQNAAVVMFYAGLKNHQRYVQQMNKSGQQLTIDLYSPGDAKKAGVSGKLPAGAEVVYEAKLASAGSTYYTLVGDQTYISDGHGGFRKKSATTAEMVKVANDNNAGDALCQLAENASLNDLRTDGTNVNDQQGNTASNNNAATASSMGPQDKARAAMNADPNIDPEFKRRINLPPDDPDYIQPTHDPDSWR